jgi:hypothetical protein
VEPGKVDGHWHFIALATFVRVQCHSAVEEGRGADEIFEAFFKLGILRISF